MDGFCVREGERFVLEVVLAMLNRKWCESVVARVRSESCNLLF